MENSSKALLIAGAILITIILITIGVYIMGHASGASEQMQDDMKSTSADVFNSKISQYCSNNVSAAKVKTFLSMVFKNNQASNHIVYVNFRNFDNNAYNYTHVTSYSGISELNDVISSANTYTIRISKKCTLTEDQSGYDSQGYIVCVTIDEK